MKSWDNEFYKLIEQFEKDNSKTGIRLDRCKSHGEDAFFESGETEKLFKTYMQGYSFAKCKFEISNLNNPNSIHTKIDKSGLLSELAKISQIIIDKYIPYNSDL
jgi:hypothetical protein